MFTEVHFTKFKKFKSGTVPLVSNSVFLVAGGNNSGKSTLLHGLAIWEFCKTAIESEKGKKAFWAGNSSQGLGMSNDEFSPLSIPSLKHLWTNLSPQKTPEDENGYTLRIRCKWIESEQTKELEFGLSLVNDRLFVKTTFSNLLEYDYIPRVAYLPPFAGITDRETRLTGAIRRRKMGEGLAGAVLRNILLDLYEKNSQSRKELQGNKDKLTDSQLRKLRQEDPWELLQQTLRTTFEAELSVAAFNQAYHSYIQVEVLRGILNGYQLKKHKKYNSRDIMVEGSGFLQWLSVYALAADPSIDTLLLDEPDSHLHCSLQQNLIEHLKILSQKTAKQVLVATHSTEIIRNTKPEMILELSNSRSPRFLVEEHQKIGMLAGLGTDYSPKIDAIKKTRKVLFIEGELDLKILKTFCQSLILEWDESWVEWISSTDHKERGYIFEALKAELKGLKGISLRDRDYHSINSISDNLRVKDDNQTDLIRLRWRRRHIESYLLWPAAIAKASDLTVEQVEERLKNDFGIAIGETFFKRDAPPTLMETSGKDVLNAFGVNSVEVAKSIPQSQIPEDIKIFLDYICKNKNL